MCAGKRNCAQRVAGSSLFVGPRIFSRHSVSVEAVARGAIMYKRRQRQHCVQTQTPCFLGNCKYKKKRSPPGASTCHFDVQTREVIDSARLCSYISTLTHAHTRTHTHTHGRHATFSGTCWVAEIPSYRSLANKELHIHVLASAMFGQVRLWLPESARYSTYTNCAAMGSALAQANATIYD